MKKWLGKLGFMTTPKRTFLEPPALSRYLDFRKLYNPHDGGAEKTQSEPLAPRRLWVSRLFAPMTSPIAQIRSILMSKCALTPCPLLKIDLKKYEVEVLVGEIKAMQSSRVRSALDRTVDEWLQMSFNWVSYYASMIAEMMASALSQVLSIAAESVVGPGGKYVQEMLNRSEIDLYLLHGFITRINGICGDINCFIFEQVENTYAIAMWGSLNMMKTTNFNR
jgi:hypothetical protein